MQIYHVNSHDNKEKTLNEKECLNLWLVVYASVLERLKKGLLWLPVAILPMNIHVTLFILPENKQRNKTIITSSNLQLFEQNFLF